MSILAILLRRNEVDQTEFHLFYQMGDEVASIISGLIDATFREEAEFSRSGRTLREDQELYYSQDDSNSEL